MRLVLLFLVCSTSETQTAQAFEVFDSEIRDDQIELACRHIFGNARHHTTDIGNSSAVIYTVSKTAMSEDHHHRASSSDEVMDTTEGKDFSDGDDLSKAPVDDLFGSGSEVDGDGTQKRRLDDDDLDSGDDEGRQDRMDEDMDGYGEEVETQHSVTMADIELGRHPIPHDNNYEVWARNFTLLSEINVAVDIPAQVPQFCWHPPDQVH